MVAPTFTFTASYTWGSTSLNTKEFSFCITAVAGTTIRSFPMLDNLKLVNIPGLNNSLGLSHSTNKLLDRKSTRLNSSHVAISYAVFCLKKKKKDIKSFQHVNIH